MNRLYAASNYDDDLCLKPPLILWFAVIYLSRAIMLPISVGIAHIAGVNEDVLALLRGLWSIDILVPSLIAVPILYSFLRRVPTASGTVRWIWAHGRIFLAVSASIDLMLPFISQMLSQEINVMLPLTLVAAAIDAYFLLYVLAARRVRDTFASFPPPLETARK
ncbi:MAG: DUF2919 family protein [Steroidobacteraceae bacterium]